MSRAWGLGEMELVKCDGIKMDGQAVNGGGRATYGERALLLWSGSGWVARALLIWAGMGGGLARKRATAGRHGPTAELWQEAGVAVRM